MPFTELSLLSVLFWLITICNESSFVWKGADHILPVVKFVEAWTGVALLAGTSEESVEPDYPKHKKADRIALLKNVALYSACGLIAVSAYISRVH